MLSLSPSFLRVCCFRGFFYNTFNLLCSSARSPQPLSYVFFCLVFHTVHGVCMCLCISYVCLFPPWNVRFKCLLLILSFLLVFSQSCCLFPHTQRFLRAALIFAAARGHYQLIDYFDCYLIPPLGRARRICASVVSRSLLFTLRLSLFCALSQVRKRELSTHQSPYRPTADGGTSGPLCFRFTLPVAACCRPLHFRCRCDSEAVQQFRVAAPFG